MTTMSFEPDPDGAVPEIYRDTPIVRNVEVIDHARLQWAPSRSDREGHIVTMHPAVQPSLDPTLAPEVPFEKPATLRPTEAALRIADVVDTAFEALASMLRSDAQRERLRVAFDVVERVALRGAIGKRLGE